MQNCPDDPQPAYGRDRRLRLWIAAGVAGFLPTLVVLGLANGAHRPAPQSGPAVQSMPTVPSHADAPAHADAAAHPDAAATGEPPTWVGRRQAVWASDGTKSIAFALGPTNDAPVRTSYGRPHLVARCLSRRADVYVVTGPLDFEGQEAKHTVRIQVDDDPEQSQEWVDSESNQELFAPDSAALSDRLARAHRLRFTYTPFNASPVTLEFVVDGFDRLAPLVAQTCGRRPPRAGR